jgi:hypothetical protein
MKIKSVLIIVLGTLACMLLLDDLVPQPLVSHDSNLVYAMGGRHHREYQYLGQPGDQGYEVEQGYQGYQEDPNSNSAANSVVPEPSTLLLLVSGLLGLAGYGRRKFLKK